MKEITAPDRPNYWVPMVANAIKVIEVFKEGGSDLTLHEISSRALVGKTSTLRILYTLGQLGYMDRDATTGKYQMGLKLMEVARRTACGRNLIQIVRPYMEELRNQFDETVNLAVLRDNEVLYVDIVESRQVFRMAADIGSRVPLHATALGKAIAAFLPETIMRSILSSTGMPAYTSRTITTMERFEAAVRQVRQRGYGIDHEEAEIGAICVAAPILKVDRQPVGAISVSGPTHRMKSLQRLVAQKLCKAAISVSKILDV